MTRFPSFVLRKGDIFVIPPLRQPAARLPSHPTAPAAPPTSPRDLVAVRRWFSRRRAPTLQGHGAAERM